MGTDERSRENRDALEEALFEAARVEVPPMTEEMTDRIMNQVNAPKSDRPWGLFALGVAATAAFLVIQFFPPPIAQRPTGVTSTNFGTSQSGEVAPVDLNLPTPKITLSMVLPETEKALSRNRESLISYARAAQTSTLIFSGGETEE